MAGGQLRQRHREDGVGGRGDDVGDEDLLAEADDEAADAVGEVVDRHRAPRQLIGEIAIPDDRAGDELREQQQVQRGVHRTLLRDRVAAVDVDDVRDRVEGVERDPDRQQHARDDDRVGAERQEQGVDVVGEEVRVLEDAEDDEIDGDGEGEHRLRAVAGARPIDSDPHPVVERDRGEHQPREGAAALGVEDHAGDEEERVAVRSVLARERREVEREQERQEQE